MLCNIYMNGVPLRVDDEKTILEIAVENGFYIPALCRGPKSIPHYNSCMLCLIKDMKSGKILPSCSLHPHDGMIVQTDCPELVELRKSALELLLSEHLGDCEGPCMLTCPARMDIPLMIKYMRSGKLDSAAKIVLRDIPLPATLGRICPAPCEKVCRLSKAKKNISIRLIKKFVGDMILANPSLFHDAISPRKPLSGKRAAVIGGGPAGLGAAYVLALNGFSCTIFEKDEHLGGAIRKYIPESKLHKSLLDTEIENILKTGVKKEGTFEVGKKTPLSKLAEQHDIVLICVGQDKKNRESFPELDFDERGGMIVDSSFKTRLSNVFAAGGALRRLNMAVKGMSEGMLAARAAMRFLGMTAPERMPAVSKMHHISEEEFANFAEEKAKLEKIIPAVSESLSLDEVQAESKRCLQCQCSAKDECELRSLAVAHGAKQISGKGLRRRQWKKTSSEEAGISIEEGKCVKCGICTRLSRKNNEIFGLSFSGRGFDSIVKIPLDEKIENAFSQKNSEYIENCPTGALSKYKSE